MAQVDRRVPAGVPAAIATCAVMVLLAGCRCAPELSWKRVTFSDVDRDLVFGSCREVVVSHYGGTRIHIDAKAGKIETGLIEETIRGKVLRQQCYVDVTEHDGLLELALIAPMSRREFDASEDPPVCWVDLGSDVVVEGILLDEICGRVLTYDLDARVVSTTLPRVERSP